MMAKPNDCIPARLRAVESDMASLKTDIDWLKDEFKGMDNRIKGLDSRVWYVLVGIIATIGVTIATRVI